MLIKKKNFRYVNYCRFISFVKKERKINIKNHFIEILKSNAIRCTQPVRFCCYPQIFSLAFFSFSEFWFKQYFICIIRSMLNSIYTIKYMSGFENKHRAYINHLLQIMSSYEWYMQNKVCPVRKYYTYNNIIVSNIRTNN